MTDKSRGKSTLKKEVRMGTSLRGILAEEYQARGHGRSSLNLVYSPKSNQDVVLRNRHAYAHFLLCEASPEIQYVEYRSRIDRMTDSNGNVLPAFDAVITYASGAREGRYVRVVEGLDFQEEEKKGVAYYDEPISYVVLNENDIYSNPTLLRNWSRILPWIAQVRDIPLNNYISQVLSVLRHRSGTIGDVMQMGGAESAYFVAAAFRGVQLGLFVSDLDTKPLSLSTLLLDLGAKR